MGVTKNLVDVVSKERFSNEAEVEVHAVRLLKVAGYRVKLRKAGHDTLDRHYPSKNISKATTRAGVGAPDIFLFLDDSVTPVCIWENKGPTEKASTGLADAQFYVEGLRKALPNEPALPRIAAGFNGKELLLSYYTNDSRWVSIKQDGVEIRDAFPRAQYVRNGISSNGTFNAAKGSASAADLRALLPKLKTLYRVIPILSSGRTPIDFTVAVLTLRLLVEQNPSWGFWAEQPRFAAGSKSTDHAVRERLSVLAKRVLSDSALKERYGDIFEFHEKSDTVEVAFSFVDVLENIPVGVRNFETLFSLLDSLAPLQGADFDIFGEVYQYIGDEATKKALGEFFTGRHIISGVLPVLFARAGLDKSFASISRKRIADVACGTGGFLTETLRLVRRAHGLKGDVLRNFASNAFFGYDIGHANASRARVNMYFAGDGFSVMEGGVDALTPGKLKRAPAQGFDVIMTNPPYGRSRYGRSEEAFLSRVVELLKKGEGWALVVLPTGVLENPRSADVRFDLLKAAAITDVMALPKHAFAPYTQQRTSIVILRKRVRPVSVSTGEWRALLKEVGHEQVSMFIVDNDGYANSDKRYPTDRRTPSGQWMHNDLAEWMDRRGLRHDSKLVAALIKRQKPPLSPDEFGELTGPKYGVFALNKLADKERGVALLPDLHLRNEEGEIPLNEFLDRARALTKFAANGRDAVDRPLLAELSNLLTSPVAYASHISGKKVKVTDLFNIARGDQGLTEQIIYSHFDPKDGIPVYGGGASRPRFRIARTTVTNQQKPITVFRGPAIVISMDGTAGAMRVVEAGEFCSNHHGRVLLPKTPRGALPFLYWFIQQAEQGLEALASNKGGSATLTAPHLEQFTLFKPTQQNRIATVGTLRQQLERMRERVEG